MTTKVWKCDYCCGVEVDKATAEVHEKKCWRNPDMKDCGSCKNHERVPYERDWTCKFGWDFMDDRVLPCEKWERE